MPVQSAPRYKQNIPSTTDDVVSNTDHVTSMEKVIRQAISVFGGCELTVLVPCLSALSTVSS